MNDAGMLVTWTLPYAGGNGVGADRNCYNGAGCTCALCGNCGDGNGGGAVVVVRAARDIEIPQWHTADGSNNQSRVASFVIDSSGTNAVVVWSVVAASRRCVGVDHIRTRII